MTRMEKQYRDAVIRQRDALLGAIAQFADDIEEVIAVCPHDDEAIIMPLGNLKRWVVTARELAAAAARFEAQGGWTTLPGGDN